MTVPDGYEHDIFVSYRRTANVRNWVRRHLVPRLHDYLVDELGREPSIFVDSRIDPGTHWPERLESALQRSHLLVAIWTPPYFHSRWCLAEWRSFQQRESALGLAPEDPRRLVYPIRYADGDRFPADARTVQQVTNFKRYKYPDAQFADSPLYLPFRDKVERFARTLAPRLDDPPPWCADWPIVRPAPPAPAPVRIPSMWGPR